MMIYPHTFSENQINLGLWDSTNLNTALAGVMSELYSSLYSTPDRILLSVWCLFCVLAGVIGNILTLTTSLLLNPTSDVDRFTTTILRNLAVSDLLYVLTRVLPSLISHLLGGWALGATVCTIEGYVYLVPVLAGMALILCLSVVKVFVCLMPLRAHSITSKTAVVSSTVIWIQAIVPNIVALFGGVKVEVNSEIEIICEMAVDKSKPLEYTIGIIHNIQIWIPSLLILPCDVALWYLAHRHTRSHNLSGKKAITTILSISILFLVSWIPTVIEEAWRVFGGHHHQIPLWFNKVHINFYFISSFGNPILYALINKRYREEIMKNISPLSPQTVRVQQPQTLSTPQRHPTPRGIVVRKNL